jgi:antitoxin component of MazEF toxin-antitoxin module
MGYLTKVQSIKRKNSEQFYINFPAALAQALEFTPSEDVEWFVEDKSLLALRRRSTPPSILKKKLPSASSTTSTNSGSPAQTSPTSNASTTARKRSP